MELLQSHTPANIAAKVSFEGETLLHSCCAAAYNLRRDVLTRHHNSCIAAKPIHNPSGVDTGPQSRTSLPSMKDLGVGLGATVDPCRDTAKVTFQTSLPSPAASNRSQDDPASMQLNPASCSQPRPGDNNAMDVDRSTAAGSKPRRPANKRGNYVSNAW